MVQSLAAQHRARVEGEAKALPLPPASMPATAVNRLVWASLQAEQARLGNTRSKQRKAELKRGFLPRYADHLSAIINGKDYSHNESLVLLTVWAIDAGEWKTALLLAAFALKHGMRSPQGFKRGLAETLLEEATAQAERQGNPSWLRDYLQQLHELTQDADIADEVSAKFHKALGLALEPSNPAAALAAFRKANQYGAHVKRDIKRLEKGSRP